MGEQRHAGRVSPAPASPGARFLALQDEIELLESSGL